MIEKKNKVRKSEVLGQRESVILNSVVKVGINEAKTWNM